MSLSLAESALDISKALQTFESFRKPRFVILAKYCPHNAYLWQLPGRPEQKARDTRIRKMPIFGTSSWDGKYVDEVPGLPLDPLFFPYVMAYDVIDFISEPLILNFRRVLESTRL